MLMWQGPTIANGHLSQGTKDYAASRLCCEPLLTVSADGVFTSILAAEVPSTANGGLSADGKTVTGGWPSTSELPRETRCSISRHLERGRI
jgi:peptide/nickel transport system substrate-binding protein